MLLCNPVDKPTNKQTHTCVDTDVDECLGSGLLIGQKKQFEEVTLGSGKL